MTFAAALERVVTYPADRQRRPAANIILDVQNRLHRVRCRENTAERKLGQRVTEAALADCPAPSVASASDELADVIAAAVESRRLSPEDAALIVQHRVLDVPAKVLAGERGNQASTIRSHRRRAERRLALITRPDGRVHGEVA